MFSLCVLYCEPSTDISIIITISVMKIINDIIYFDVKHKQ